MNYEQWVEKFEPIKNPYDEDAGFDGYLFETYGEEKDLVNIAENCYVWTWIDEGEGEYIIEGYHRVNAIGYFITKNPWEKEYNIKL